MTREQALSAVECDSTFVLDVISRIAELVEEVSRARASVEPAELPTANTSTAVRQATEEPSATTQDNARWIGSLTLGVRVNESPD